MSRTDSDPRAVPGRFRGALGVLLGRNQTPLQMEARMLDWELTLSSLLDRFGALLARQSKAEKRRIMQELEEKPEPATQMFAGYSPKREMYAKLNRARGWGAPKTNDHQIPVTTNGEPDECP